jgi:peptidyl-prolyl cis-trans isomerase A (cyclophilin A)
MIGRTLLIVLVSCGALILHGLCLAAGAEKEAQPDAQPSNPIVLMKTSLGQIKIQLWPDKAPETVKNFLSYVNEGFFNGTIFHRVIGNFMIQGGGFTPDMAQKPTHAPIKNEARGDVGNERGTIAMARTMVVDSATAQFFINVVDNPSLNHMDNTPPGFGYAVFGKVIDGMDVVDKIKDVPTVTRGPFQNVPVTPVVIESVTVEK